MRLALIRQDCRGDEGGSKRTLYSARMGRRLEEIQGRPTFPASLEELPINIHERKRKMADMRAKVKLNHIQHNFGSETLIFNPVAKKGGYPDDGLDENNTFAKYTPSGQFAITVANPALLGKFKIGEEYYVDFTKAEQSE